MYAYEIKNLGEVIMRKEDTPERLSRRKYEEANKEKRKETSGTFSTYFPRKELEEINAYLRAKNLTKVELIRKGYEALKDKK